MIFFIKKLYQHSSPPQSCNTKLCKRNKTEKSGTIQWLHPNQTAWLTCPFLPSTTRHGGKEQLSTGNTKQDEGCDYPLASKAKHIHPVSKTWKPLLAKEVTEFLGVGRDDCNTSTCNVRNYLQPTVSACTSNEYSQPNCSHLTQLL